VAAYVIRSPEQVDAAGDHRELTPLALYSPVLCILSLLGLYYSHWKKERMARDIQETEVPGEGTPLMPRRSDVGRRRCSVMELHQVFRRSNEVARRSSVQIMGFSGFDTRTEKATRESQLADLKEFILLGELDFDE
jgi:hypothetical protein